jgi:hypothetical protein
MNDRELLELAAKAVGRTILQDPHGRFRDCTGAHHSAMNIFSFPLWNPLTDDGDALRLAVKLRLQVAPGNGMYEDMVEAYVNSSVLGRYPAGSAEKHNGDPQAATRRAITRAAAEIGRSME